MTFKFKLQKQSLQKVQTPLTSVVIKLSIRIWKKHRHCIPFSDESTYMQLYSPPRPPPSHQLSIFLGEQSQGFGEADAILLW